MKFIPEREFLETKSEKLDDDALEAIEALGKNIDTKFAAQADEIKSLTERLDAEEAKGNRPGNSGRKDEDVEMEKKAFETFIRKGREALTPDEVKSLIVSNDQMGGFIAPAEFIAELDRNLVMYSPVRSVARVMNTSAGVVRLPKRTGGLTASWVGETEDRPETQPSFGQSDYPTAEIAAYVDVSNAMLEDSAFDIEELLAFEFAEEFGAKEGTAFVIGDNVNKPAGFMQNADIGFTNSGNANLVTADGLIDVFHAIKAPYRVNGVWAMNSTTLGQVRKLKDGTSGQYLLTTAGIAGAPATTLLGRPVIEMPDMPDVAAGTFPIAFGDFKAGYRIFDRIAASILRDPYSQAAKGMTRFHGRRRVAAGVSKAEAFRKLKISA